MNMIRRKLLAIFSALTIAAISVAGCDGYCSALDENGDPIEVPCEDKENYE